MSLMNKFGPRHVQLMTGWLGSASIFGASAGLFFLYVTEWKVFVRNIPFYGSKFPPEEQKKQ